MCKRIVYLIQKHMLALKSYTTVIDSNHTHDLHAKRVGS